MGLLLGSYSVAAKEEPMTEVSGFCDFPTHGCKFDDSNKMIRDQRDQLQTQLDEAKESLADEIRTNAKLTKGLEYYAANLPHRSIARTILDEIQRG